MIGVDRRIRELNVLEQLQVSDIAASSVDLSSFRLDYLSSDFYF